MEKKDDEQIRKLILVYDMALNPEAVFSVTKELPCFSVFTV